MAKTLQSIRGMNDILPNATAAWQSLTNIILQLAQQYGYEEIRTPLVEQVQLFHRSVGDTSDIVQKEMYQFVDQNDDVLALRPEGTAACVRACIQHGLIYNQRQKLWYMGPMYRRERPQKGRYRQFHQFGLEAFGYADTDIEIEQLLWMQRFFAALSLEDVQLEINTLGDAAARASYTKALQQYLSQHRDMLDADSLKRLETNPLRILDSKVTATQALLADAPCLLDHLPDTARAHFEHVQHLLDQLNVPHVVNTRLVRGLDYYNGLVFEWTTHALGAQGTLCAGGRYDNLVSQLGGQPTPAFGCAMGIERILSLATLSQDHRTMWRGHVLCASEAVLAPALLTCEQLRNALPNMTWTLDAHPFKLKNQLKRANKANATLAIILDHDAWKNGQCQLKWMQSSDTADVQAPLHDLIDQIKTQSTQPKLERHT